MSLPSDWRRCLDWKNSTEMVRVQYYEMYAIYSACWWNSSYDEVIPSPIRNFQQSQRSHPWAYSNSTRWLSLSIPSSGVLTKHINSCWDLWANSQQDANSMPCSLASQSWTNWMICNAYPSKWKPYKCTIIWIPNIYMDSLNPTNQQRAFKTKTGPQSTLHRCYPQEYMTIFGNIAGWLWQVYPSHRSTSVHPKTRAPDGWNNISLDCRSCWVQGIILWSVWSKENVWTTWKATK